LYDVVKLLESGGQTRSVEMLSRSAV